MDQNVIAMMILNPV